MIPILFQCFSAQFLSVQWKRDPSRIQTRTWALHLCRRSCSSKDCLLFHSFFYSTIYVCIIITVCHWTNISKMGQAFPSISSFWSLTYCKWPKTEQWKAREWGWIWQYRNHSTDHLIIMSPQWWSLADWSLVIWVQDYHCHSSCTTSDTLL